MSKKTSDSTNIESLKREALKYKSRTEFYKKCRAAYKICLELDIMDMICSHMVKHNALNGKHGNCTMSNEDLFVLAQPFTQRSHFKEKYPTAYNAARCRGLLDQICSHMIPAGSKFRRKIYVFEHSDNTAYVGLSYDPKKRRESHLRDNKTLIEKSKTTIQEFKILTDWLLPKDAQKMEKVYIKKYLELGWVILNRAPGGALGGHNTKWTKEECYKIAKECSFRVDFRDKNPSAYNSALKNGWLNEICKHMLPSRVEPWIFEELKEIAANCRSRSDFKRKNAGAYKAARNMGVLDQICAHMPKDCRILAYSNRPKVTFIKK